VIARLWLLVLLVLVGAFAPSRVGARVAETRTQVFLSEAAISHPESSPQVADLHQENGLWHYEHAPGCVQAAESAINPRLTSRLDAWRAYKAGGGSMEMQQWVRATQRQYGGVSGGYRSGFGDWFKGGLENIHGNSLAAKGAHDVYVLREAGSGRLLHFDETGRGYLTRFAEHQRVFGGKRPPGCLLDDELRQFAS
jgi:hypothetical protein